MSRLAIRTVVRDITFLLKKKIYGFYILPEDLKNENFIYSFLSEPIDFQVYLYLEKFDEYSFQITGEFDYQEENISILIRYNEENILTHLYEIIGELNDILAHELQHARQFERGDKKIKISDKNPLKYYTSPQEIEAQIAGFKRLSKLRKKDFFDTLTEWFENHKEIHQMNNKETDWVIKVISEKYSR